MKATGGAVCREEKILWWAAAAGCERDRFRVFLPLFYLSKLPPSFCLSIGPVFIGKMLHGSQNWSLNFFFFVNLIFLNFFCIFESEQISTSTQCGKSMILKMTREKLNAFQMSLKI
jgi:hypothetical protein